MKVKGNSHWKADVEILMKLAIGYKLQGQKRDLSSVVKLIEEQSKQYAIPLTPDSQEFINECYEFIWELERSEKSSGRSDD